MEPPWKILIAGDSPRLHARAQSALADCTFFGRTPSLLSARSSAETIEQVLRNPDLAVLLADTAMESDHAGLDAVEAIRGPLQQRRLRIVLCARGPAPAQDFIVRHDVHDYTGGEDFTDQKLQTLVQSALGHYQQLAALERTRADLDQMLEVNRKAHSKLVTAMEDAVETRSCETGNHMRRVAEYARLLGRLAGLDDETADLLYKAAPLHDTGKLAIPDAVLQAASIIAGERHERWDGTGYPHGWRGEQIHLFGRITALADVFDALCHPRVYKDAWPVEKVLAYLRAERGTRFDPDLIDLFFSNLDPFIAIHSRLAEPPRMH